MAGLFSKKEQKLIRFTIRACPMGNGQTATMFTMVYLIYTFSVLLIQPLGHFQLNSTYPISPHRSIHMNPCSLFICLSKSVWVIGRTWPKYTHALAVKGALPASSSLLFKQLPKLQYYIPHHVASRFTSSSYQLQFLFCSQISASCMPIKDLALQPPC